MLDRDGIAAVGERVMAGDILINKQSPTSTKDVPLEQGPPAYKQMPVSWKAPQGESCYVDKVLLTQNDDGHIVIKVTSSHACMRLSSSAGCARPCMSAPDCRPESARLEQEYLSDIPQLFWSAGYV